MTPTTFVLLALATWRLASLLANEAGPFYVFKRIRRKAAELCRTNRFCREFHLSEALECEWCNSLWIGAAITGLCWPVLRLGLPEALALPLALSTCAILVKHVLEFLKVRTP